MAPQAAEKFIEEQVAALREQVGDKKVLLALSGGVDSSVVAALLIKAIGGQLVSVHVNHGLLRKGEPEQVVRVFRDELKSNLIYVDAVDRFLDKLAGVSDPENRLRGSLVWHQPWGDGQFPIVGAKNFTVTRFPQMPKQR